MTPQDAGTSKTCGSATVCGTNSPGVRIPEECPKLDHTGRPLCHFPVAQRQGVTAISPGTRLQVCVLNAHFLGLNYIGFIITFKIK